MKLLKRSLALLVLALAACSLPAEMTDLTQLVRDQGLEPVVSNSWSLMPKFPPINAFDGNLAQEGRWLSKKPVTLDYHFPKRDAQGNEIMTVSVSAYAVHRLTAGSWQCVERMPTDFIVEGSNDGGATWEVVDRQDNLDWRPPEMAVYRVDLPAPVQYASYRFTFLRSQSSDGGANVGVGEICLYGELFAGAAGLEVTASPGEMGTVVPAYGAHASSVGETIPCSATGEGEYGNALWTCRGHVLDTYDLGAASWIGAVTNEATSFDYVQRQGQDRLTWLWKPVAFGLASRPVSGGTVTVSPAPDRNGYFSPGAVVSVEARPAAGGDGATSAFLRWEGDVPAGKETENPLAGIVMDKPRTITPVFRIEKDLYADRETGDDANAGSAEAPFRTFWKGYGEALDSILASGRDYKDDWAGATLLHLAPSAGRYRQEGRLDLVGELVVRGEGEGVALEPDGPYDVRVACAADDRDAGHPIYGKLVLQDVDWVSSANRTTFAVGQNMADGESPCNGILETRGGSFVETNLFDFHIGFSKPTKDRPAETEGRVVFGAGTSPVRIRTRNFRPGWRVETWAPSKTHGLFDGSAVTGGSLVVDRQTIIGYFGGPSVGEVLFGPDWDVAFGTDGKGNVYIGSEGQGSTSRGTVSFGEGGSFASDVNRFIVGSPGRAPKTVAGGIINGRRLDRATIVARELRVGSTSESTQQGFGSVDFHETKEGSLVVTNSCQIGYGPMSFGRILLGDNWRVRLGREEKALPLLAIGCHEVDSHRGAQGALHMKSGSFAAFADEFYVAGRCSDGAHGGLVTGAADFRLVAGRARIGSDWANRPSDGVVDAGASTNASLEIKEYLCLGWNLNDGMAPKAHGRLDLGRGEGFVGQLLIGVDGDPVDGERTGRLGLDGFRLAVGTIARIRRSGRILVRADGVSAGLELSPDATIDWLGERTDATGTGIEIDFVSLPAGFKRTALGNHVGFYHGFKWGGDHLAEVEAMVAAGQIAWKATGLEPREAEAVGVFYDVVTDATYIGLPLRKAREGTILLLR